MRMRYVQVCLYVYVYANDGANYLSQYTKKVLYYYFKLKFQIFVQQVGRSV